MLQALTHLGSIDEDTRLTLTAAALLSNVTDQDADLLSVQNLSVNNRTITENGEGICPFTNSIICNGNVS